MKFPFRLGLGIWDRHAGKQGGTQNRQRKRWHADVVLKMRWINERPEPIERADLSRNWFPFQRDDDMLIFRFRPRTTTEHAAVLSLRAKWADDAITRDSGN